MNKLGYLLALLFFTGTSSAAITENHWILLSNDEPGSPFVGQHAGLDLLWGTGDEINVPGENAGGHASVIASVGGALRGYFGGSSTTLFDDQTGVYNFTAYGGEVTLECPLCVPPIINDSGAFALNFGNGAVNAGQANGFSFTQSYDIVTPDGDISRQTGSGVLLFRGFAPADVTADPNLIAHFHTVLPLLPDNWAAVSVSLESWEFITGPNAGFTGEQSLTFYLTAVPIPPAFALFVAPLLAILRTRSRLTRQM